ncbi:hypothetical protein BOX37_05820 [Nocardia mangyaensis]|uniref:ABC transporter domain-containing protein n=1 Tax=Nocardia mangyaensis TaxID=2213200 RepID=A0A1J0VNK2_9NOCA|nr:ATP-binding cassette domain-containing protein [Nocardia mangyaensis]APE33567.1 hypothetical protein BOX37_05820 [Nocardia mangyaensis]
MTRSPALGARPAGTHSAVAAVDIRGLVARFADGRTALHDVDCRVSPGEVVALVGVNGAGKSTLLRSVVGLHRPSAGSVLVHGVEVATASRTQLRAVRRDTGFLFQRSSLISRMRVFEVVLQGAVGRIGVRGLLASACPAAVRAEAMDCLDRVGLADRAGHRLGTLSGGQQQRVAVARMLMQRPTLILADEPVAGLDPTTAEQVMALLRDTASECGATVLLALHHTELARTFCGRIVGMRAGRVVLDRPAASCDAQVFESVYTQAAS